MMLLKSCAEILPLRYSFNISVPSQIPVESFLLATAGTIRLSILGKFVDDHNLICGQHDRDARFHSHETNAFFQEMRDREDCRPRQGRDNRPLPPERTWQSS